MIIARIVRIIAVISLALSCDLAHAGYSSPTYQDVNVLGNLKVPGTGYMKGAAGGSIMFSTTVPRTDLSGLGAGVGDALGNAANSAGGIALFPVALSPIAGGSILGTPNGPSAAPQALTTLPAGLIYPYQSSDTGAQPQTINSILSNIVIATNYMSAAQVTDGESYTGSLDLASTVNQIISNNAGKTIIFPAGKWRSTAHWSCPAGTTIQGVGWGELTATTPSEPNVGTVIYQDYLAAADPKGIEATGQHCTVANLEIRQPQPTPGPGWVPNEGPWAIYSHPDAYAETGGHRLTVRNVMLRNVTYGIFTDRARGGEFTDIYGQPMKVGIQVTGNGDTSTWRNIQFGWSFWTGNSDVIAYQNSHVDHFVLGRVDTPMMTNIFSFGAKRGIRFYFDISHSDGNYDGVSSGVKIANIDLDNCSDCFVLEDNPEVYVSNFRVYPNSAVSPSRCIDSYGVVNPGANFGNLRLTIMGGVCINSGAPALSFAYNPGGTPNYPQYIKLDGFRITQPLTGSWSSGSPAISTPSPQATVQAWDITVDGVTDTSTILGGNGQLVWKRSGQDVQGNITAYTFTTLSTVPAWLSINSAAGADMKAWDIYNDSAGVWHLAATNDAGSAGTDAITITRSGYTPTLIALNASTTAPTPATSDNSTKVATTAFVQSQFGVSQAWVLSYPGLNTTLDGVAVRIGGFLQAWEFGNGGNFSTTGIVGAVSTPSGTYTGTTPYYPDIGVAGYASTQTTTKSAVGIFGYGGAQIAGASIFGGNTIAVNCNLSASGCAAGGGLDFAFMASNEADVNVFTKSGGGAPSGSASGYLAVFGGNIQPTGDLTGFRVNTISLPWKAAFRSENGSATVGLGLGAAAATGPAASQPIQQTALDAASATLVASAVVDATGQWIFYPPNGKTFYFDASAGLLTYTGSLAVTALPTSAGAGGIYVCVDSAGAFYKKASCP